MSDSRLDFEHAVRDKWSDSYSFERAAFGGYADEVLEGMWWAWQINCPQFTALCHSKTKQIGNPVGYLVENEAGGLAAVHNLGRVTWLDDCVAGRVEREDRAQDGGELPARKDFEKEEFHGEFPEKEESLIWQDGSEPAAEVVSVYMGTDIIENRMLPVGTKLCICPTSAVVQNEPTRIMCEAGACVPLRDKQSEVQWMGEIFRAMMDAAPQQPSAVVPEGWRVLPEDLETHLWDFKAAVYHMVECNGSDTEGYWSHQAKTLENIEKMIAAAPNPPSAAVPEWTKRSDGFPTKDDADYIGNVWVNDRAMKQSKNAQCLVPWETVSRIPDYTHWMPTGFKRPQPPEQEEES